MKADKLPQVMSFESASAGAEDYKFENEKRIWRCGFNRSKLTRPL